MASIRPCREDEHPAIAAIVNAAAEAYRDVIPADRWREPYMPLDELEAEIDAGVEFWGYEADGALLGIMGIQPVRDVDLIRHAYVAPASQGRGVGGALLEQLGAVGHAAACSWAPGPPPNGPSASTAPRLRAGLAGAQGRAAARPTGRSRSARSRPRWCSPGRRSTSSDAQGGRGDSVKSRDADQADRAARSGSRRSAEAVGA